MHLKLNIIAFLLKSVVRQCHAQQNFLVFKHISYFLYSVGTFRLSLVITISLSLSLSHTHTHTHTHTHKNLAKYFRATVFATKFKKGKSCKNCRKRWKVKCATIPSPKNFVMSSLSNRILWYTDLVSDIAMTL